MEIYSAPTVRESARRRDLVEERRMNSAFLDGGAGSSSPSSSGGRSRGRKQAQTASESAAARKAGETAAAWQASRRAVREIIAERSSSGRRAISQARNAVLPIGDARVYRGRGRHGGFTDQSAVTGD
nr:unnamed protein product [Digitaria exilis]